MVVYILHNAQLLHSRLMMHELAVSIKKSFFVILQKITTIHVFAHIKCVEVIRVRAVAPFFSHQQTMDNAY